MPIDEDRHAVNHIIHFEHDDGWTYAVCSCGKWRSPKCRGVEHARGYGNDHRWKELHHG